MIFWNQNCMLERDILEAMLRGNMKGEWRQGMSQWIQWEQKPHRKLKRYGEESPQINKFMGFLKFKNMNVKLIWDLICIES